MGQIAGVYLKQSLNDLVDELEIRLKEVEYENQQLRNDYEIYTQKLEDEIKMLKESKTELEKLIVKGSLDNFR